MATIRANELFEQMLFGEDKKADAIIAKTISMAEEGDTACIRLCLDRIAPHPLSLLRPGHQRPSLVANRCVHRIGIAKRPPRELYARP